MIRTTGIDLVEIDRVRSLMEREPRFIDRVFTPSEQAELADRTDPVPGYAARFAAKEAFQKVWPSKISWHDVWIVKNGQAPVLAFSDRIADTMKFDRLVAHVSLSHAESHAIAIVILEEQ